MIWALHGAAGLPGDWMALQEKGTNLRRVFLWDQVAPFSEWAETFCLEVAAQDNRPSILGYSMGGRLALHALLARPAMWRSAIIVSAHPGLEDQESREQRAVSDAEWARRFREEEDLAAVLTDWDARPVLAGAETGRDLEAIGPWRGAIANSLEVWGLAAQEHLTARLGEVTCPVLWVTGAADEKYDALAEGAVAALPAGEHVVIEACGHRVPWEQPDRLAREVIAFQNRVALGRA